MQRLIIVLAFMACSLAAPLDKFQESTNSADLYRPSPINPDIPSDPKPEEKITLITGAEVKPLITSKSLKLPGPLVLPRESLTRTKREDKDSSESDENSSEQVKQSSYHPAALPTTSLIQKHTTSATPILSSTHSNDISTQSTPSIPKKPYSPLIHQHNEHLYKPTIVAHTSASSTTSTSTTVAPTQDHVNDKRDIPVPLTRKFHHDDDDETKQKKEPSSSAKVTKEEIKQEEQQNEGHKTEPVAVAAAAQPQAAVARPIPVAELFAKKPSTE